MLLISNGAGKLVPQQWFTRKEVLQMMSKQQYDSLKPAEDSPRVSNDQIREVFLANGFTIKPGETDLKPYVYAAARALLTL